MLHADSLINRLSMAQGAIALCQKNLDIALTLVKESDNVGSITDDKEQGQLSFSETALDFNKEVPF